MSWPTGAYTYPVSVVIGRFRVLVCVRLFGGEAGRKMAGSIKGSALEVSLTVIGRDIIRCLLIT